MTEKTPSPETGDRTEVAEAAVHKVLSGWDLMEVARQTRTSPETLALWTRLYRSVGRDALERITSNATWYYLRIHTSSWDVQDELLQGRLGSSLEEMRRKQLLQCWWFMRKGELGPHIRLRLQGRPENLEIEVLPKLSHILQNELDNGTVIRWHTVPYEPEINLFGGLDGMDLAHTYFGLDSEFYHQWLKCPRSSADLGRLELSAVALRRLLKACGLERTEEWDLWLRVLHHRSVPTEVLQEIYEENRDNLTKLAVATDEEILNSLDHDLAGSFKEYLESLDLLGRQFKVAAAQGQLSRGLRSVLSWCIIFHWNRWALSGIEQASLAYLLSRVWEP